MYDGTWMQISIRFNQSGLTVLLGRRVRDVCHCIGLMSIRTVLVATLVCEDA